MAKSKNRKNGTKKYGRNKKWCEWYRRSLRKEKNQIKKLKKHLAKQKDHKAQECLRRLLEVV